MGKRRANMEGTYRILGKKNSKNKKVQNIITITTSNGEIKRFTAVAATMAEAHKKAMDKYNKYIGEIDLNLSNETMKVELKRYFEEQRILRKWATSTARARNDNLKIIIEKFGNMKMQDLQIKDINGFVREIEKKYSNTTANKTYSILNNFLQEMYQTKRIKDNMASQMVERTIKKQNKSVGIKFFEEKELKKIRDFNGNAKDKYYANMFYFMFLTGLRGQELRCLEYKDIDYKQHKIKVNKAIKRGDVEEVGDTKTTESERDLPFNKTIEYYLKWFKLHKRGKYIFHLYNEDKIISSRQFDRLFDNTLKKCNIQKNGRGPHCLRHSFASLAAQNSDLSIAKNQSLAFVSGYLGHSKISTTLNIYSHVNKKNLGDIY